MTQRAEAASSVPPACTGWNNIPDQYGWSFELAELRDVQTRPDANDTTIGVLHPRRSHCAARGNCLLAGFLPYDRFPRTGDWGALKAKADVYHLTFGCMQEEAPCSKPGVRPFRGHRQRLDRYDDVDFEDQTSTLRALHLWLVDQSPTYHVPDEAPMVEAALPLARSKHALRVEIR